MLSGQGSHWIWRAIRRALPFSAPYTEVAVQVVVWVAALGVILSLRGTQPVTEQLWWALATGVVLTFVFLGRFVWSLSGDAETPTDTGRRSAVLAAFGMSSIGAFVVGRKSRNGMGFSPAEELTGNILHNRTFRITDLIGNSPALVNRDFRDCTIHGPAVLIPSGYGIVTKCKFEGPLNVVLWKIHPEQAAVAGAISLSGCTFVGCTFHGVGFAGTSETIDKLRANNSGAT